MNILALKPGHDGHICAIEDGTLVFSFEAEKDSGARFAEASACNFLDAAAHCTQKPDVVALSGWSVGIEASGPPIGAGYVGLMPPRLSSRRFLGSETLFATSSHERSHLLCSYAMSPYPQREPCYALLWEGYLGAIYEIDQDLSITRLENVMLAPGDRYAFVYALVDAGFSLPGGKVRLADAGKVMALAGFEGAICPSDEEQKIIQAVVSRPNPRPGLDKSSFVHFKAHNCGADSRDAKRLARLIGDAIFETFIRALERNCSKKLPLIVGGGCGLNCEWNSRLRASGLFDEVFVPPCCNDTGSAIGTAVDAQWSLTGNGKLKWSVYAGQNFIDNEAGYRHEYAEAFIDVGSCLARIARELAKGRVLAWISGRAEIGPRALGNRSILAAPFSGEIRDRLNHIKRRESFRPIAPVCLEEDFGRHFGMPGASPYMLFFAPVTSKELAAVTHVDGTARPQSVSRSQNPRLHELLLAFKQITGFGVLCNTSLNFHGRGFINSAGDLFHFAEESGLDGVVIDGRLFLHRRLATGSADG